MRLALVFTVMAAVSCNDSPAAPPPAPPATRLTACPAGADLVGSPPPAGLRQRCQKSDVERHGASREWYETGRERSYSEWWDGQKHGRFTLWFKTGQVRSQGSHRHGAPAGEWSWFREDGSVRQHQRFAVPAPPADWLAQAIAGHPPAVEPTTAAVSGDAGAHRGIPTAPEDEP